MMEGVNAKVMAEKRFGCSSDMYSAKIDKDKSCQNTASSSVRVRELVFLKVHLHASLQFYVDSFYAPILHSYTFVLCIMLLVQLLSIFQMLFYLFYYLY